MEMYKNYLEELHDGKSVIHDETGFASYWIRENELGKECYIEDIYVAPKYRRTNASHELAKKVIKVARKNKCSVLTGTVVPSANNAEISLQMMLSFNFKLLLSTEDLIWFKKDL